MRFTESAVLERRREKEYLEDGIAEENVPPPTVGLRDRLSHFTWPWFACTMSTGAVAVVIAQTPNQFTGLQTIGKIFFILDIILFSLFTILMITRFCLVPKKLILSLHHPIEGLFFGAYWVSIALILNCIQLYGGPSTGDWLNKALEVCFWLYCGVVFIVGVGQYYIFFQDERLAIADAMPAWIFPIYPLLVVGPLAGVLIKTQPVQSGWQMWVGAVALQGMAWAVAFIMYCMYMQRLMGSALPMPSTRPGMFVSVGPAGYTATALFSLGVAAPKVVPPDQFTDSIPDGNFIANLGVMSGFFLILFSFWFFCVSSVAVLTGIRRMTFTLNWWAFVFPNAGLTLAIIQAGSALRSPAVDAVSSALTVLLVGFWGLCAGFHVRALWRGEILWPGRDEDKTMKV